MSKPHPGGPPRPEKYVAILALTALVFGSGCATLQQVAALRRVQFDLDRVTDVYLAGVRADNKRSYSDLRASDVTKLVTAIAAKRVPLQMIVHIEGTNPASNNVTARLVRLDWTLFIEDQETVSGRLDREFLFEPGKPVDVPLDIDLDLYEFFSGRAQDLFDLALAVAGIGGPTSVSLKATPTIETPIGPIRYPTPITIEKKVGSS